MQDIDNIMMKSEIKECINDSIKKMRVFENERE